MLYLYAMKLVFNLPQCCTTGFFGNLGERPLDAVFMEQKGFLKWKMAKPKLQRIMTNVRIGWYVKFQ